MPTVAGATDEEPEEETLGQRKKRLQAQAAAQSQAQPGARNLDGGAAAAATADADAEELPPRPSSSMANLLSANPVGSKPASKEYRAAEGTLLHASERQQAKNRRHILEQNKRSSSFGLDRPLVGVRHSSQGNTAAQNGGFAGGLLNAGLTGPITSMSTPTTAGNGGGYFAPRLQQQPPQANGTNYTYGLPQPQVNMNPMAYQGLPGFGPPLMNGDYVAQMRYAQQYGYLQPGYFPMQMPMAMQTEAPMPQGQRELIDRWRSSIAP
ncbi:hypothetical protein B0A49_13062 [Cryomyces minteri]|uniref:Uncharacterized protein n=1 Tax=Cryomyces minteri TaxID=331657 RepID=A0A4U0WFI0_9PEZI|nr:hypothetical protein B0A49_13062 [Cryomyces minteri]